MPNADKGEGVCKNYNFCSYPLWMAPNLLLLVLLSVHLTILLRVFKVSYTVFGWVQSPK